MTSPQARTSDVLVIGAGPGGLSAAVALKARGVPYEIVDAGRAPGGLWDIERADAPMYQSAHFISSKTLSGFPDFPMPAGYPDYPRHDQVLRYIQAYARHHELERHATFGARVTSARPANGGWTVELDSGERRECRDLCVATGANWIPRIPGYPGTFAGKAYHSAHYRSAEEFRDQRVLVVGGGNSGVDIACDAARTAKRALISLRRGYWFIPKYVFGSPSDVFSHQGPQLPRRLEEVFFGFLLRRVFVGDLTHLGLPEPDHPVLASHPIMNTQVLHHLGHGDLTAVGDVRELHAHSVVFVDGREEEVDLIVWATGYERAFPFLEGSGIDAREGHLDTYLNVFHRERPGLSFMGLFETDGAAYPLMAKQAALIAGYAEARGKGQDTSAFDALRRSHRPDLRGGRRYLATARHNYYVRGTVYERELERVAKRFGWR
jgi:cation diffusion facilitator CzcD-associated flavoprotein CzcO